MPHCPAAPRGFTIACIVGLLAVATGDARAQQGTLRGLVTDSVGIALSNAEVRVMSEGRVAHTDAAGAFVLRDLNSREVAVTVRRMGYHIQVVRVALTGAQGDSVRIRMVPEPMLLPGVEVNDPSLTDPYFAGFEARRTHGGGGTFITEKQIAAHNSSAPSDAMRGVPGLRFVHVLGGLGARFISNAGTKRSGNCVPVIWLDGQRAPFMEVDDLRAEDIHGMEIYRGASTIPPQFMTSGAAQCGAIVVWTRRR